MDAAVEPLSVELAKRIKALRVRRGLSQEDVAHLLGIGRSTVSVLESGGRGANFNLGTLEAMAWALGAELVVELRERV
jgi:transcriptional regulator with XRE-family HTH domain